MLAHKKHAAHCRRAESAWLSEGASGARWCDHRESHADWGSLPSLESARVVVAHPPNSSSKLRALLSADVIERRRPQQPSRIVRSFHRVLIIRGRELWEGERSVETIVCAGDDAIKVPTLRAVEALRGWLMRRPVKEERFL